MQIGDVYRFKPEGFEEAAAGKMLGGHPQPVTVIGRIVYINWRHRFFMATSEVNGQTIRECFKF